MNILMLDVDGVMNSSRYFHERTGEHPWPVNELDPAAVAISRDILDVCQQTSSLAKQLLALGQRSILDREVFDVGSELGTMARAIERRSWSK